MEFGIAPAPTGDAWQTVQRAETHGFSQAWFYDTLLLFADVLVAMVGAALRTTRSKLGADLWVAKLRMKPSRKYLRYALGAGSVLVLFGPFPVAVATEIALALPLPYQLVQEALVSQVFVGPQHTAQMLEGKNACNVLTLSEARIEGAANNTLRVVTKVTSRSGTPLTKGRCLPLFEWSGLLEAHETPYVIPGRLAIGFRVVDSNVLGSDGERSAVPGVLWDWIKQNVHPRLESFSVDLTPLRDATHDAISATLPEAALAALASLTTKQVIAAPSALEILLAFDIPPPPRGWTAPAPAPALSIEELERWRLAWQTWDSFATWLIKQVSASSSITQRDALAGILLDARHDLVHALTRDSVQDPVPQLFLRTWDRLLPLLTDLGRTLAPPDALRYLSFITAAEALHAMNGVAPQFGLQLDRDSLRRLARILQPAFSESALDFSVEIDPELRALFGFTRDFEIAHEDVAPSWWQWLIAEASAAGIEPALTQRLNGWVPAAADLDAYLREVSRLFDQVAATEVKRGKIKPRFLPVYQALIRATAWQETCWRQYIVKTGQIQTIRSVSGSVGIMQVNTHVWRGIYDLNGLIRDVGYNARAGNEILVHYLVDYAIKRKEHQTPGGLDNLARATYAVYNGGPGHLARYRKASTEDSLRKIDASFLQKYRAIQTKGAPAIKQCYGF